MKGASPGPLAVGAGNELLVADGFGHILGFSPEGEQVSAFAAGVEASSGIAYDQAEDTIYALGNTAVNVVPVPPPGPLVASESAEAIAPKSATLTATINPEGPKSTSYHFEYGTTTAYGSSTATKPLTGGEFERPSGEHPDRGSYHLDHLPLPRGRGERHPDDLRPRPELHDAPAGEHR
jgi:hypothetical protein